MKHEHASPNAYFAAAPRWPAELRALRRILLDAGLEETLKWNAPVYTCAGRNVVGIAGFQNHFGLWFFQGALLADEAGLLLNAQAGRTRAMRQLRFTSGSEVDREVVRAYVDEAMALARAGRAIAPERKRGPLRLPAELAAALRARPAAAAAFEALTPGRRREYAEHVASAKREATKQKRIEKILPMIEAGVGLNDRYRSC